MFDSVALNVVISLVFIYLLYSLLATTLTEIIASMWRLRAKTLELAILRMLSDSEVDETVKAVKLVKKAFAKVKAMLGKSPTEADNVKLKEAVADEAGQNAHGITPMINLVTKFYEQPLIKFLGEGTTKKPSYIKAESFSKAFLELCKKLAEDEPSTVEKIKKGIDKIKEDHYGTGTFLASLMEDANNDLEKFKELLENWFNETMDRTTGWYKKQTQIIILIVGFVIAVAFNVNTIGIVRTLSSNPKMAENMANIASEYAKTHQAAAGKPAESDSSKIENNFKEAQRLTQNEIRSANSVLGLGWEKPADTIAIFGYQWLRPTDTVVHQVRLNKKLVETTQAKLKGQVNRFFIGDEQYAVSKNMILNTDGKYLTALELKSCWCFSASYYLAEFFKGLLGFLITALAISLGAPFWFDILNKVIQLRSSKKIEETPASNASMTGIPAMKRVG